METKYSNFDDLILCKLNRTLENLLIELELIETIREGTKTKYRLYLKDGRECDIIRSLRQDIAISLGLKRINVTISKEYAELEIPNSNV